MMKNILSSNFAITILMLSRKCNVVVGFGNVRWYNSRRLSPGNNYKIKSSSPVRTPSSAIVTRPSNNNCQLLTILNVHTTRDADTIECLVGGTRYEYVPIPDAMKETTLYVGNLCEFAHDDDLSQLFRKVSKLHSVPACIARKVDTSSLQYGFVSFPTVEEKEQAIIRFNNYEWRGKRLKVEEIKDSPDTEENVRIPGKLVAYVTGGKSLTYESNNKKKAATNKGKATIQRISRDDVERLSRGQASKQRGYGSRSVPHRLNEMERAEWERAAKRGYLTLVGGGNRRTRKGSPMINIHRQWCDARAKPQILLFKATNGRTVDQVVVDFSPLRLNGLMDGSSHDEEDFMVKWKAQTITAAIQAGLEIKDDIDDDDDNDDDNNNDTSDPDNSSSYSITLENTNPEAWATKPIWQLPVVSLGIFEGERSKAKLMAKTLAELWEIPEETKISSSVNDGPIGSSNSNSKRSNRSGKSQQQKERKRGGGHRQAW